MASSLQPIAVELAGSHLIEASAGTGKTYAITTLYVRFLLELELRVAQILVVTYTNAATAELRLRIRNRLRDTLAALDTGHWPGDETLDAFIRGRRDRGEAAVNRDRALLLAALHAFDEAAIFTIHGFCQRVLQESAFESGVAFDVDLLANLTGLIDEVVHDYWIRELHDAQPAFVRCLRGEPDADGNTSKSIDPSTLQRIAAVVATHPDVEILPDLGELSDSAALDELALRFKRGFVDYTRFELRRRKTAAHVQSFDDLLQHLREALAGQGGDILAAAVRDRYRAALIDEFQDTDAVQYEIFRRIYVAGGAPLFLIGDPKQAIYAFRGADVFTYVGAKAQAAATHTLLTNRRSDPALLRAINAVFERATPAFLFEAIGYERIEPAPGARDRLGGSRLGKSPFEILFVRREGMEVERNRPHRILKPAATRFVTEAVAARVAALLAEGATLRLEGGERPLIPADVAVLCRMNREAAEVQEALRQRGVHAVLQSDATVFETPEAVAVERTMQALANPSDNRTLRAALASSLIGLDAGELHSLESDEAQWDVWAGRFRDWHDRWRDRSFFVAFRGLLDELDVEQRLLGSVGGERRLTDVLHLVELLHRASVDERLGPQALVHWLARMRTDAATRAELLGEAARIRLESDESAVKLVTIHRSKGLEYPVVFCPFSWGGGSLHPDDRLALRFHDPADGNRFKLDLGSEDFPAHQQRAELETLAENLRLLYVAFTRAKHYCGVVWGAIRDSETSALAYLLHQDRSAPPSQRTRATSNRVKGLTDDEILRELEALAQASDGGIDIVDFRRQDLAARLEPAASVTALELPEVRRRVHPLWRMSSFSALTASPIAALSLPDEEGLDHDAAEIPPAQEARLVIEAAAGLPRPLPFADLPAGARTGQLVHRILEKLDFRYADVTELRSQIAEILARSSERALLDVLSEGIDSVLDTSLAGAAGPLRLRQIGLRSRLNELEFLLPVGGRETSMLTAAKLAEVFAGHAARREQFAYAERLAQLSFTALQGYLKGFIDLVFEHDGKWYVVDYKTNRLGLMAADYRPEMLESVMAAHHYHLQYHLYSVALHRYLGMRLSGYRYDEHFGGVYYLFLRGMAPRHPEGTGIYEDRPTTELIEDLSSLFTLSSLSRRESEHPPFPPREGGQGDRSSE
jgi:exodeoxyribonuclease V beta subunit